MEGWIKLNAHYSIANEELVKLDIQHEEESYVKEEWFKINNIDSITSEGKEYNELSPAILHIGGEQVHVEETVSKVLYLIKTYR